MFSNAVINNETHERIVKTYISDHFLIFPNIKNNIWQEDKIKLQEKDNEHDVKTI